MEEIDRIKEDSDNYRRDSDNYRRDSDDDEYESDTDDTKNQTLLTRVYCQRRHIEKNENKPYKTSGL